MPRKSAEQQLRLETLHEERPTVVEEALPGWSQGIGNDQNNSRSSEYGDEDIDLDFLVAIEQAAMQGAEIVAPSAAGNKTLANETVSPKGSTRLDPNQSVPFLAGGQRQLDVREAPPPESCSEVWKPMHQGRTNYRAGDYQCSEDEFGISDDDLCAEMQELAAQCESQNIISHIEQVTQPIPLAQNLDSALDRHMQQGLSNDDFESAFDDDDEIWNEIGTDALPVVQAAGISAASQVCGFHV